MNPITRAYHAVKAAFVMRFSNSRPSWSWGTGLGRTRIDYAGTVGDGRGNSIVVSILNWIGRTLPEAPLQVVRVAADGTSEVVHNHPLTRLLARPNPYYSGALLLDATVKDFKATGNAYWLKVRSEAGRSVQLWWVPATLIEPRFPEDGTVFITHYDYTPNGETTRLDPSEVVHFRNGIDPQNPRKGLSDIVAVVREIATDDEAANYTAALLRNLGVIGVVIAPDDDKTEITQADADQIKAEFEPRFTGDNRGRALVLSTNVKVSTLDSFSPDQMDLTALRAMAEGRVAAVLGVQAAVVGLPMGLTNTKVGATMAEMREEAYENAIIPTQRLFAAEITTQLLPDLGNADTERVEFDTSKVRVLQPDLDKLHTRLDVAVRGGWMTPNEARERVGLDQLPAGGDVLYVPVSAVPTPPEEIGVAPEPLALPPPSPLRALPPPQEEAAPKGRRPVETKSSASNLAAALTRVRARHQAPLEKELASFLDGQRGRVVAALGEKAYGPPPEGTRVAVLLPGFDAKALSWRDLFDAVAEESGLRRVLERWYRRVLGSVHGLTEDAIGISFDLDDKITREYLAAAGDQIRGITETTRDAIAKALQEGQAAGEGVPDLARRIENLTAFGRPRATLVSRTELGQASNRAAIASYTASGVVHGVQCFDGDGCGLRSHDDPEKAHGKKLRLDQMAGIPMLAHPACVRAWGAIVDASDLEDEAAA